MKKNVRLFNLLAMLLCIALLPACSTNAIELINSKSESIEELSLNTVEEEKNIMDISQIITYEKDDFYSDWKNENPSYIELKGTVANSIGTDVDMKEDIITITKPGVYVLSGKLDNGQILVNEENGGTVKLVLNGVEIHGENSSPIYVKKSGKTIISLEDGTENIISDDENYVFEDDTTDEPNAAIFSKDDLTINGTGMLTVYGNYNNGISSKDKLKITGGEINIYSADDGLMGRDLVAIKDGIIKIKSNGDGIKSTNDQGDSKGFIILEEGAFNIESSGDGIQSEKAVYISGGDYNIFTGGGSSKETLITREGKELDEKSTKGIKASTAIAITGGTLNLDTYDDGIHSNDNITITEGDIIIKTGDDGIHGDTAVTINGGRINIIESYEGIEGAEITITNGDIYINASDDGINISDGSIMEGHLRQNDFSVSENRKLTINGGYIVVNGSGDGLDSNGSIYMTDGIVIVNGPTDRRNSALDFDGKFEIHGGILVAAGSAGMAQAPVETSTQYSISMNFSTVQEANTLVNLQDNEGNSIVTFAPEKDFQNIVISSPKLEKNVNYTLYTGGNVIGNGLDILHREDIYENGTKLVSFTISDIVTWLSETGVISGNQQRGLYMKNREPMNKERFLNIEELQNKEDLPNKRRLPDQELN